MFFAEDRIPIMQKMILARTREEREQALEELLPMQREDFKGLYREMKGYPVTIRLLDPPLHEFLPRREDLMVEVTKLELIHADRSIIEEKKQLLERVEELHEINPMLGLRGCRLGIVYPEISRMQARAKFEAACEGIRGGGRGRGGRSRRRGGFFLVGDKPPDADDLRLLSGRLGEIHPALPVFFRVVPAMRREDRERPLLHRLQGQIQQASRPP